MLFPFQPCRVQMIHPMQPIQPRVQQGRAQAASGAVAICRMCGQRSRGLGQQQLAAAASSGEGRLRGPAPAAMPTPMVHMAKLARPLRWGVCCPYASYATHPRTHPGGASIPGCFDQGGSREGASQRGPGVEGMPHRLLIFFWGI